MDVRLTWQAQLLRDAGRGDEAVAGFEETLQADKAYVQVSGGYSDSLMQGR
jgi:hypothetical protein